MFDPSRIVFHTRWLMITRYEATDRHGPAPWREVLNLRRYSVTLWPGTPRRAASISSAVRMNRVGRDHLRHRLRTDRTPQQG